MVRYLATEYAPGNIVTEGVEAAAEAGHLHVLKWLHDEFTGTALFGMRELWLAAENGHLEVLHWLHEHLRPSTIVAISTMPDEERRTVDIDPVFRCRSLPLEDLLTAAGDGGHLHVVKWLASEIDKWQQDHPAQLHTYEYDTFGAALEGHMHVLEWLHNANYEWLNVREVSARDLMEVMRAGHFEVVKWHYVHQPRTFAAVSIDFAAASGRIDMLEWMLQVGGLAPPAQATVHAAYMGHFDVLRWLYDHDLWGRSGPHAMNDAAAIGHLEMVKFLHEHPFPEDEEGPSCTTSAMNTAARHGHAAVVEWLDAPQRRLHGGGNGRSSREWSPQHRAMAP